MNRHLFLILFLMFFNSCDQYPDLEPGMYADIMTNKGNIILLLEYGKTPLTVSNFVALAEGNHPSPNLKEEYKGKKYYALEYCLWLIVALELMAVNFL